MGHLLRPCWLPFKVGFSASVVLTRILAAGAEPDRWGRHDLPSQALRVARDHQFLVGGNHPRRDPTRRGADARTARSVRLGVEVDAEPGSIAAHALRGSAAAFSPMPAVNTIASSPPSAAASEPSSRPMRYTTDRPRTAPAGPGSRAALACRWRRPTRQADPTRW